MRSMDFIEKFALYTRATRQAAGMTQDELADLAGISPNTVARVEKGYNARLSTCLAIAGVFGHTIGFKSKEAGAL